jgi:hypothetical protein
MYVCIRRRRYTHDLSSSTNSHTAPQFVVVVVVVVSYILWLAGIESACTRRWYTSDLPSSSSTNSRTAVMIYSKNSHTVSFGLIDRNRICMHQERI